jgi:hypothetical protein
VFDGRFVERGNTEYEAARTDALFNARHPSRYPAAVLEAASEADVVAGVRHHVRRSDNSSSGTRPRNPLADLGAALRPLSRRSRERGTQIAVLTWLGFEVLSHRTMYVRSDNTSSERP